MVTAHTCQRLPTPETYTHVLRCSRCRTRSPLLCPIPVWSPLTPLRRRTASSVRTTYAATCASRSPWIKLSRSTPHLC